MMRWLVSLSLRHAVVVCALTVDRRASPAARSARNMPLDVFPEFAPPLVEIQTEAPGCRRPRSKSLVSVPIESALTGVPGVEDDPLEVGARPVVGRADPRRRRRSDGGAAARAGAARRASPRSCRQSRIRRCCCRRCRRSAALLKIGVTSKTLSQMEMTTIVALDGPAAADGRAGRRQRRDLGPARSAAAGAGRSRSARTPIT